MRLAELLDVEDLRKLTDANYKASGMPIGLIDAVDGAILLGVGWQEICTHYHRVHAISAARCRESDDYIKTHLVEGKPTEYRCKNGLRDIGIPIVVAGEHLATLFMGQFFYEEENADREFFVEQARQLGFDEAAYLRALDRVPVFSHATIENILTYNTALARFIAALAERELQQKQAEARAAALARFPQENPDPVLRLASDDTIVYANPAALECLGGLGVAAGRRAPEPVGDLARRAREANQRVRGEVTSGAAAYALTVAPVGSEVNVYGQDVTARKRVEQELRDAIRAKDEFLGMLSHELRNPLAPIRNAAYVLRQVEPGGEQARRAQRVIERQTEHLARIVDDLVDVSRIVRGKIELHRADVDLADVVTRTAEDYRGIMNERGLRFTVSVPPGPIWIRGDETRLVQVLGNLLQNAAKFTSQGGAIAVSVTRAGDAAEVRVRDTGVGIAPELLDKIFQPFTQGEQDLSRTSGGLGLGLALVSGLVSLHGGTVTASSGGPGRGAEFTVRLPVGSGGAASQ